MVMGHKNEFHDYLSLTETQASTDYYDRNKTLI